MLYDYFNDALLRDIETLTDHIPSESTSARSDLYVGRTMLLLRNETRFNFFGLFCYRDINPGEFIGLYSGKWIHESENFEFGNKFAVTASNGMSVAPPQQSPNPQIYSIAMANEPQAHGSFNKANAFLRELIFDRSDIQVPQNINEQIYIGLGLFACDHIPANTEILWFYGESYQPERDYEPGQPCTFQGPFQDHLTVIATPIPFDAVTPFSAATPSQTDSSDESYT